MTEINEFHRYWTPSDEALKKLKILLVDDDEDDFIIINNLLSKKELGLYSLDWVIDYEAALHSMKNSEYDVYLIDYFLGQKNGIDLIRDGLAQDCKRPMIILTGYGHREIDKEALLAGAADYLVKGQISGPLLERSIRYSLKRSEAIIELEQRQQSLKSLFDSTFEGIIVHELNGLILDVNQQARKIFGCPPEKMIGMNLFSYLEKDKFNIQNIKKESSHYEILGFKLDSSTLHIEVATKEYSHMSKNVYLTSIRDISERKIMEAQILHQDRLASAGLLASSLAHEIGTPLGVIRGRAEILEAQMGDVPLIKKNLDVIITQIDRVSKLIRSLLNLTRTEGNSEVGPVIVKNVIEDVMDLLSHELAKSNIQLKIEMDETTKIMAESELLHQVLLNFIVNSVHAIEEAQRKGRMDNHRITLKSQNSSDRWILLIEDSGCGVSPQNQRQIFKPFFTTKKVGEGTGLGLATSLRIMNSWGGSITLESTSEKGTTFKLYFNRAKSLS